MKGKDVKNEEKKYEWQNNYKYTICYLYPLICMCRSTERL